MSFKAVPFNSPSHHFQFLHPNQDLPPPGISKDGTSVSIVTSPGSNWWHNTERDEADGKVWGFWREVGKEGFEVRCNLKIAEEKQVGSLILSPFPLALRSSEPESGCGGSGFGNVTDVSQYDQATVFLYLTPHLWVKAGVEYDNDQLFDGAVVTNPFSDWSIQPHKGTSSGLGLAQFTISYAPPLLRVFLDDVMIREVTAFAVIPGHTPDEEEGNPQGKDGGRRVFVGVMACSPTGGGVEGTFEKLEIREGVRPK